MRMPLCHYCDCCGNYLEDPNEEVGIVILELPNSDIFFFCSEGCMDDFIREHTVYATLYNNGLVDRD
jgi:hypothetical protein